MSIYKKETEALAPNLGSRVGALFTERLGGVSSGPWGGPEGVMGLNVGTRVGDNAACVRMNRAMVAQLAPEAPRWMTQVHGVRVVHADDVADDTVEADASWTMTPGVVCAVQVADCLPVLIAENDGRIVAAVHAGWRSLAAGIIEETVREMRRALAAAAMRLVVLLCLLAPRAFVRGWGRASGLTTLKRARKWPRPSRSISATLPNARARARAIASTLISRATRAGRLRASA